MFKGCFALALTVVAVAAATVFPGGTGPEALASGRDAKTAHRSSSLRRPVALALSPDGRWLYVANQGRGSVSVIDLLSKKVAAEHSISQKLVDLAITQDADTLLTVDEAAGALIVCQRLGPKLTVKKRLTVGPSPQSLQVTADGSKCIVACLWPRSLTLVALGSNAHVDGQVELPFAPRNQLLLPSGKLVVTEAFGGRLAVVDVGAAKLESVRSLPDHNIRGLALSADRRRLLLTAQMLNHIGHAQRDDIHWGNLLTNNIRSLRLTTVLDPNAKLLAGSDLLHLGDVDHGTGDPCAIAAVGEKLAVTLSGVNELAVGGPSGDSWKYVATGRRPTALLGSANNRQLLVANTFADSVSVLDLASPEAIAEISLGPVSELGAAERGELLFHDARLSQDGWFSCQSCHTDGHTSSRLADNLSDGTYGSPKRILTLLGAGDTGPWAWNGGMAKLEGQIRQSITSTMAGPAPSKEQVADLTAFVKTLPPAPPRQDSANDEPGVLRGKEVFAAQNCARCHTPPLYTSGGVFDVGLHDESGHKTFNPPSLRGVSQAGPYFHDGRAASLEDVFIKHRHQLKADLTKQDIADLIKFLGTI